MVPMEPSLVEYYGQHLSNKPFVSGGDHCR
ncbi:hypothetical protein ABID59_007405 [Bradyrhizobium sp. S3.3.6]